MSANGSRTWEETCAVKRSARDDSIPAAWRIQNLDASAKRNVLQIPLTCGILTEDEIRITSDYDAVGIVEGIRERLFTSEAVTTAFCKRAAIAQQLTNCLSEIFFEEAIENARQLDTSRLEHPERPLGPLFGLPISLKDSFKLEGKDATIGMTYFVDRPAVKDSTLVTLLRSLGAVFYCKTNVPQTMMTADSDNNVFGRTLNPNNRNLTAGGSTGGEGSLISQRGSVLGVGTDIAGSIRIPSCANGIYGFKPSSQIIPYSGQQSPVAPGTTGIIPSAGPMTTSMRSCQYFIRTILEADPSHIDPSLLRIPWLESRSRSVRPLRIGLLADDGLHSPSPPMRRALREAAEKLVAAGQTIVPIQLPNVEDNLRTTWELFSLDGSKFTLNLINSTGEPLVPSVIKQGLVEAPAKGLEDFFRLNHERDIAISTFHKLWLDNDLDVILTLPAPHTAVPFDQWDTVTYTALYNLYDCPACVIPVGKVSSDDKKDENYKYGEGDKKTYDLYTGPEDYADAPTSIQLVGSKQRDQELSDIAVLIDGILNGKAR